MVIIVRTDEGQHRPKYFFKKCGTNIYFFLLYIEIWSITITEFVISLQEEPRIRLYMLTVFVYFNFLVLPSIQLSQ